jgi:hypothetical protein
MRGGASASDAEVFASDVAAALELSTAALDETTRALQRAAPYYSGPPLQPMARVVM